MKDETGYRCEICKQLIVNEWTQLAGSGIYHFECISKQIKGEINDKKTEK